MLFFSLIGKYREDAEKIKAESTIMIIFGAWSWTQDIKPGNDGSSQSP